MQKINLAVGAFCVVLSSFASADTQLSSIKACGGADTGLSKYMQPIKAPTGKAAGPFKCVAPSTYVEIVTNQGQPPVRFCTADKGLLPASAYRIDMLGFLKSRAPSPARIEKRKIEIDSELAKDSDLLASFDQSFAEAHSGDGMLKSGAIFALNGKVPYQYRSKDGKHLGILDSLKNYHDSLAREIANLKLEKETYAPGKLAAKIEDSADNFAILAQLVLSDCPNTGRLDGPVVSCHSGGDAHVSNPDAESLSAEMSIIKEHDDSLIGTGLVGLRTESLFEQGNLKGEAGPQEQFLACNEVLQTFGVTRFGCKDAKDAKGGSECRILVDGAAAFNPAKIVGGQSLGDAMFGKLPDTIAAEAAAQSHAKPGDTALAASQGAVRSTPALAGPASAH